MALKVKAKNNNNFISEEVSCDVLFVLINPIWDWGRGAYGQI